MDTRGTLAAGVVGLAGVAWAQCPVLEYARIAVDAGSNPGRMVVADFNRDGTPDIACGDGNLGYSLRVLLGNPSPNGPRFGPPTEYYLGFQNALVLAADLTGDGFADLLTIDDFGHGSLQTWLSVGDGTFMHGQVMASPSTELVAADLDGDGYADLAAPGGTRVRVYQGNGGGGFRAPVSFSLGGQARHINLGDFDGDGIPDLAATGDDLWILRGNEAPRRGTFTIAATIPGDSASIPVVGDFNGDGRSDMALVGSQIQMLLSDPARPGAAFLPLQVGDPDLYARGKAVAGDLNGDGRDDLIVMEYGAVSVYLARPDGLLGPRIAIAEAWTLFAGAVGDLTADGRPDVIVSAGDHRSLFIHANRFCAADFNCDGFADFFDYTGYVLALETGDARADVNGDGFLDFFDYAAFLDSLEAGC